MGGIGHKGTFEHVRIGPVPQVVHEDGCLGGLPLGVENKHALAGQRFKGAAHQVIGPDGVLLPRMLRSGIDERGHAQLTDAPHALKIGMGHDGRQQSARNERKTVDGVVDDDVLVVHGKANVDYEPPKLQNSAEAPAACHEKGRQHAG